MELFSVRDVFGDTVCLSDARWQRHILATHPEVGPYLLQLETALTEPDCVYSSSSDPDAKLFYRRGITQGRYRNLYLKVVVSYASSPASVKTAFFSAGLTGGKLLWIKFP